MPPSLRVSVGVPPAGVDRHGRAEVDRQRDHLAGVEIAGAAGDAGAEAAIEATVGAVVLICRVPAGL